MDKMAKTRKAAIFLSMGGMFRWVGCSPAGWCVCGQIRTHSNLTIFYNCSNSWKKYQKNKKRFICDFSLKDPPSDQCATQNEQQYKPCEGRPQRLGVVRMVVVAPNGVAVPRRVIARLQAAVLRLPHIRQIGIGWAMSGGLIFHRNTP
ncbi:hypothetical protein [Hydrogenophaga sp.]|uniref:hypothetical protein n=1 Tax=Hydrogenophaga sp. TaxID=1904254 RepID=UPI003F6BF23D